MKQQLSGIYKTVFVAIKKQITIKAKKDNSRKEVINDLFQTLYQMESAQEGLPYDMLSVDSYAESLMVGLKRKRYPKLFRILTIGITSLLSVSIVLMIIITDSMFAKRLNSPQVDIAAYALSWNRVENASFYEIIVNGKHFDTTTTTTYEIDLLKTSKEDDEIDWVNPIIYGTNYVSVIAKNPHYAYIDSNGSNRVSFYIAQPSIQDLDNDIITDQLGKAYVCISFSSGGLYILSFDDIFELDHLDVKIYNGEAQEPTNLISSNHEYTIDPNEQGEIMLIISYVPNQRIAATLKPFYKLNQPPEEGFLLNPMEQYPILVESIRSDDYYYVLKDYDKDISIGPKTLINFTGNLGYPSGAFIPFYADEALITNYSNAIKHGIKFVEKEIVDISTREVFAIDEVNQVAIYRAKMENLQGSYRTFYIRFSSEYYDIYFMDKYGNKITSGSIEKDKITAIVDRHWNAEIYIVLIPKDEKTFGTSTIQFLDERPQNEQWWPN